MKINFHTKLFIVLGAVVCLSTMSILFIIQETTKKHIQENIKNRFENTQVALRHLQELRTQFAVDAIDTLTISNAHFRSVLSTASVHGDGLGFEDAHHEDEILKDSNLRLASILPFLSLYEKADIFIVTNADGILLLSKAFPGKYGIDLTNLQLFEDLSEKPVAVDVWHTDMSKEKDFLVSAHQGDAVYHIIAKPVVFRDEIHGVVIFGSRIDKDILLRLKNISEVDLALYSSEGIHTSTLPVTKEQALSTFMEFSDYEKKSDIHETFLDKETFLSMYFPILANVNSEEGSFIVLKSLTQEMKFVSKLRMTFIIVGGVILLVAIGLSFFLAKGITKPVKKLAMAAKNIGSGKLDTKVDIRTGDELEALGNAFNGMVDGLKERDFIKSTFERYVSYSVAEEIIKNPDMLKLGGERKALTIFFTDIGNFTNLSEKLTPEEVVKHLNEYFEGMSAAILECQGTIDKFQGDSILAFWGAPIAQENHALFACQAALKCRKFLHKLEEEWKAGGLPSRTYRFGINTGEVVVGNVGSATRFEYTIIGDDVNLASRLEGANKYYGTQIMISEATYSLVKDTLIAREMDVIRVVGKTKPIKVYELVDERERVDEERIRVIKHFEVGIHAYRNCQWEEAISSFEHVLQLSPDDKPSNVYIQRCCEYQRVAPPKDWDGVFTLSAK
ncbi:MAG: HAMP domain-containing protein [Candidatus Scalindua sp.]|jgi:adenylate cyclase|nr:HAMP domain-containing protein [Candidatus Scalindua sp.]MBT5305853.1 HAMP domain-containing protein [Candidatus Scalindua sp.]MBT6049981.1 HAMP domain-containing protein [Candidatus Scalindua sp.]MBT6230962.1 HAMP domain-containing protein [Candidatus Scalindua sp.]MBT6563694.1 HAMP domain-containing protein [Candidatus Scalindua sp.]